MMSPSQMLSIYGGITALVYMETDSFRLSHPFLSILPFLALVLLTINLAMPKKPKVLTSISFIGHTIGFTIYYIFIVYYCFFDVFTSIPIFVMILSVNLAINCFSITAAGSLWKYGASLKYPSSTSQVISFYFFIPFIIEDR
ncbi:unnamed protein product [Dracunculus medinensis]|uniref:Sugar transporter SWEET1 n=1 Tax=Dracunculus medinensis TaxID=318479 RepID=A0A0N4UJI8_DRAME|nr:unnamed protein product [Dracunculus medinensis]